jgi:activator of HSP90 ATPase
MPLVFEPDCPVTDDACRAATGKTLAAWFDSIEAAGLKDKRREAIQKIYEETGRGKDVWWPTTIWVEYDRAHARVKKDGRLEGFNICCTKSFKLPSEALFPRFADEAALQAWIPAWSGKVEDGASFQVEGCTGTVGRIRENKDLRLAWQSPGFDPSEVEIQFNKSGDKTTVNIYHKRVQTRSEGDGLRRWWAEALDRLKSLAG